MRKIKWVSIVVMVMLILSYSTGAFASPKTAAKKDIVDTAVSAGDFKTLVAALKKAGLVETLKGKGPYTVFAPTDEAFAQLLRELGITKKELLARKDLKTILLYHVVSGNVQSRDLKNGMMVNTLAGKYVTISLNPIRVNGANVISKDIKTSNGVIHVIDKVLLPK